jgi:NADPH-dependent ferric siderophore reductase
MPRTSRTTTVFPISVRGVRVVRVADVTPGMRRVTLTGDQLDAFATEQGYPRPAFDSPGFDDDIRLFFPYPGHTEPVLPIAKEVGVVLPKDPRPLSRVYSVRRWDPETRELDVDFVRHGTGMATTWAYRATPGDRIHFVGPSRSKSLPAADWLLVAADDTALPAVGRLLEELPAGARAQVFVEIAEDAHRQALRENPGVQVTWLSREGAEAGTTSQLADAVRAATWWEGRAFAWVAGEQAVARDIRRHLVEDRGMPKEDVEFTGYWRRSAVVPLAEDEAVPDPEEYGKAAQLVHDLTELVPPIAIREALRLGVPELISRGVTTTAALAEASGANPRALAKLLRYLRSIDLLDEPVPGEVRLTEAGEFLASDRWIDMLHPDGAQGRQLAGIHRLGESLRTGAAAFSAATGADFAALRADQAYEDLYLDRVASFAGSLAEPLARSRTLHGARHVVIHSNGAGVQAREITAAHPDARVTVCALPAQADWLRRDLPLSIPDPGQRGRVRVVEQSIFEPSPEADAVVVVKALAAHPDLDAALALRRAAEGLADGGRILLIEDTLDEEHLDEHETEADLVALTRDGTGVRTADELAGVIRSAGLRIDGTERIGWGSTLLSIDRS